MQGKKHTRWRPATSLQLRPSMTLAFTRERTSSALLWMLTRFDSATYMPCRHLDTMTWERNAKTQDLASTTPLQGALLVQSKASCDGQKGYRLPLLKRLHRFIPVRCMRVGKIARYHHVL